MTSAPLLSVFIPSYNYGRYIGAAIESILSQSFSDFELIIIDNASTDDTVDVVRSYRDERIRFLINPDNFGPHRSFEQFLHEARGTFLRTLCADDVLVPKILELQVNALIAFPTLGLVTCDMLVTDAQLENGSHYALYPGFADGAKVIAYSLATLINCVGGPSNYMYNRACALSLSADTSYSFLGDLRFGFKLIENASFLNINVPGYYYRRHSDSETHRNWPTAKQNTEWYRLIKEYDQFCHLNAWRLLRRPLPPAEKRAVFGWLARHALDLGSMRSSLTMRLRQTILGVY